MNSEVESPKPWYREGEMLVALCALIVSVCSLAMMVYEATLERKAQKATVWPQLNIGVEKVDGNYGVIVKNAGVGPAIVKSVKVEYQGKYFKDWSGVFLAINQGKKVDRYTHSYLLTRTISANETIKTIALPASDDARYISQHDGFDLQICYCSILEDCWIRTKRQLMAKAVDVCPAIDETTFMQ